jgi:hypothetical protein
MLIIKTILACGRRVIPKAGVPAGMVRRLVFLFADAILQREERKDILKNRNSIVFVTLLILLAAIPMTMAKDSYNFVVSRTMFVAGTEIKSGTYDVKYEVNNTEATVLFYAYGKAKLQVKGKVAESGKPADYNSLMIGKDASGREAIKGLMFRGKTTTIEFE